MRKSEMERIVLSLLMISVFLFLYAVEVVSFSFGRSLCSSHDSLALLHFKHSLNVTGDYYINCQSSYPKTTSWNSSSMDCCRWDGVTCDGFTGHVIGLDLSCSRLEGTIHPNSSLFQLRHLQTLDLSFNDLSGSQIPQGIGQLVSLTHLNLSYCSLQGRIPLELSYLSKLVSLDLSDVSNLLQLNQFGFNMLFQNLTKLELLSLNSLNISSSIPVNVSSSSSLRYLDLASTNLRGDLPENIFLLPNLETLRLSYNMDLTISLPKFNWSNSHTLAELDLSSNNISGGLPTSLGSSLKVMKLYWCNLIGTIPESIGNLSQITLLDLSDNHLQGKIHDDPFSNLQKLTFLSLENNALTGPVPSSLVNLTKLELLSLRNNSLSGSLPPLMTANGLQKLNYLDLSGNSLNGSIPSWMTSLPSLTHLYLGSNHFTGPLPPLMTANGLQKLNILDLSENSVNGSIPSWMLSLPSLTNLDLGSNHFTGPLPEFKANSLKGLDLSQNQLDGPIPQSFRDHVNLNSLLLGSNNFSGEVGAEMFSSMTDLESLDLSHSGLSWSGSSKHNITLPRLWQLSLAFCHVKVFPDFLLNAKELGSLNLSGNAIQGQLPKWVDQGVFSLDVLDLSQNYLTSLDHIPWQSIEVLYLQSNSLIGPLPSSLCQANSLYNLNLSYNNLSGEIPNCLFISPTLSVLELRGNNLHGPIPNIFSGAGPLYYIGLSKNKLEGPIPRSLVNCTSLKILDLGNNNIHDTFPTWLETLHELEVLILKSNRFYGSIVTFQTKSPFPNVRIFDLSANSFTGSLPTKLLRGFKPMMNMDAHKSGLEYMEEQIMEFGIYPQIYEESVVLVMKNLEIEFKRISKVFTTIDLSRNKFEGEIPEFIGNLNSLVLLNLSHNNLSGHIPVEMKNMSMLEALDLSFNQLTGKIPEELTSLTFLEVLNLSHNHLVGPIPRSNQFNTFPNDSYFGNSELCGFPLSNECGRQHEISASVPVLSEEDEPSFLSEMTWQSVLIGYACGLTSGFSILYLIYLFERPRWFIDFFTTITHEMIYRVQRGGKRRNFRSRRRQ